MRIYCAVCRSDQECSEATGKEIYPHRPDLARLEFYQCNGCGNYVGCHKDTGKPLGIIVSGEVKKARIHIHELMDPVWKSGRIKRSELYRRVTDALGYRFHTAEIKTLNEARHIYRAIRTIIAGIK